MSIPNYGVLKAHPIDRIQAPHQGHNGAHYEIHVVDEEGTHYQIAINVLSSMRPFNLLQRVIDNFTHPIR